MRNSLLKTFAGLTTLCLMLAIASPSLAQWRGQNRYNRATVDRLIRQAENHNNQFVLLFDRALDNSRLEGTIREDRLNQRASELQTQLNTIRQAFNQTRNPIEIRSQVSQAMNLAVGINNVMRNRRLDVRTERQWLIVRSDLNQLARVYNLSQLR